MDWLKKLENVKNFYQEPGFVLPEPGPTEQDDKIELETYGWDFMSPKSTGPREGSTVPEFKDALTEKLVPELGVSYKSPKGWSVGAGPWAGESDPSINFQFRKEFDDGGVATPKRGLVDEPGSYAGELGQQYLYKSKGGKGTGQGYFVQAKKGDEEIYEHFNKNELKEARAYAKKIEKKFKDYEKVNPKALKGKELTVANQYAELFELGDDYNKLDRKQKHRIREKMRRNKGKFVTKTMFDLPSKTNQEKIKNAFPDVEFDFKPGQKHGVPFKLKNGKVNPVFSAVINFKNNNYVMSRDAINKLPVSKQREIVSTFELPSGVKEWNFDVLRGGNRYGIPFVGNEKLYQRIKNYTLDPKNFKVAAELGTPDGWLLHQMYRAWEDGNKNYVPVYDKINNKKKIVGFRDNQFGKGKAYYSLKKYSKKFNGTLMSEHPDYKNTKKFIDIANKAKLAPNKVITDLLVKGGIENNRVTLNSLLNYMVNEKGVKPTQRALVLHHKGGAKINPTRDFQILNRLVNQQIMGVETKMRADPKNITPKNIQFLKDAGASITIGDKTYGGGPKSAIGGFKQAEQFVQQKLEGFGDKDFKNLNKYLKAIGCPNNKAMGGRIGFQSGTTCLTKGVEAINSGKFAPGAQSRNAAKFLNKAYKLGRGVMKFGVIPEALFVAGESLVRMGMGDTLDEALLRSVDWITPGDQTRKADLKMLTRTIGSENAQTVLRANDYKKSLQRFNDAKSSLEQNQATFDDSEFGYMANIDSKEILARDEKKVQEAEADMKAKFQPEAVMDYATMQESEAEDIRKSNSKIREFIETARQNEVEGVEQIAAPKKVKKAADPMFTMDDLAGYWIPDEFLKSEQDRMGAPELKKRNLFDYYRGDESFNKDVLKAVMEGGRSNLANRERLFGTQGTFGGQPLAGGGIAGVRKPNAIPPISGPSPQGEGLSYLFNRVREG